MCRIKLGYQFTYLYAAPAPVDGHLIALLLPDMTAESFALFLQFSETQMKMFYSRGKVLLVLDQASAHHSNVTHSSKVVLHYLPAASPELNCVGRFFEEIRKPLSNRIFKNVKEVEKFLYGVFGSNDEVGSSSILVVVGGMQDYPLPQQIECCSAIHLPFDRFEFIDLSLHLPITPWQCQCIQYCFVVTQRSSCKAFHLLNAGLLYFRNPIP